MRPDFNRERKHLRSVTKSMIEGRVARYRSGDLSQRNPLIEAHILLAINLANKAGLPRNRLELQGVALLALVEGVEAARTALTDNQITPYLTTVIKDQLREAMARDSVVSMAARTRRYKIAQGTSVPDVVSEIPLDDLVEVEHNLSDFPEDDDVTGRRPRAVVPFARPEAPSPEFCEALRLAVRTESERQVVALKMQGETCRSVAAQLGVNKSKIGEQLQNVKSRFLSIYAG